MVATTRRGFRAGCIIFTLVLSGAAVAVRLRNAVVVMREAIQSIPAMAEG